MKNKLIKYCLSEDMDYPTLQAKTGNPDFMNSEKFKTTVETFILYPNAAKEIFGFVLEKDEEHCYVLRAIIQGIKMVIFITWEKNKWHVWMSSDNNPKIKFFKNNIYLYFVANE